MRRRQFRDARIGCPTLHVNPKMLARPDELESDLLDRRDRAEAENRVGEIGGIDMTLTFLRAKRDDTQRKLRQPVIGLGIPGSRRRTGNAPHLVEQRHRHVHRPG